LTAQSRGLRPAAEAALGRRRDPQGSPSPVPANIACTCHPVNPWLRWPSQRGRVVGRNHCEIAREWPLDATLFRLWCGFSDEVQFSLEILAQFELVEPRMSAVASGSALRFPPPLIEPDVRISRIRLSDRPHDEAHGLSLRLTV
jgi:hypothetical protein